MNFCSNDNFLRPGHGAPTQDIRKKKFTEHQLDRSMRRSQSLFDLDNAGADAPVCSNILARCASNDQLDARVSKHLQRILRVEFCLHSRV